MRADREISFDLRSDEDEGMVLVLDVQFMEKPKRVPIRRPVVPL
jgi:hypothetical protein